MPLIAIASADGIIIDSISKAPGVFLLYRFDDQGCWQQTERRTVPRSPSCQHLPLVTQAVALLLADVDVILAAHVSKGTVDFMRTRGIMIIAVRDSLEQALESYSRRGKLLDTLLAHTRRSAGRPVAPYTNSPEKR
ncbi:MAG: NifB/NifX family molybdenum-iron cluster-binding protein [Desulfuromonadaceae bacterium]